MPFLMPTPAGQYDRRITIIEPAAALDSAGQEASAPATVAANIPAVYLPGVGSDRSRGGTLLLKDRAVFRIHYRTDLNESMRITFDGQVYRIVAISPHGRGDLHLECERCR